MRFAPAAEFYLGPADLESVRGVNQPVESYSLTSRLDNQKLQLTFRARTATAVC